MHSLLKCCQCGSTYSDHRLLCDACPRALLRTEYLNKTFLPVDLPGIFRFRNWLPGDGYYNTGVGPCVFESEQLSSSLGLKRLFIAFNGYWPEKGALNITGSFKDHEAAPTLVYFREKGITDMVLASVGNTARAFAYACSENHFSCCIVIPEHMLHRLWLPRPAASCVRVLALRDSCDYYAAIRLGEKIVARFNVMTEGGARNVARRDGMGTSVLEFARLTGEMPRHYFQAIGSGAGAIAAYEAGLRLRADGRFGERLPVLHVVQNAPFAPIHEAWQHGEEIAQDHYSSDEQIQRVKEMYADVLANSHPPFGVAGGVREALKETHGQTYLVSREDALVSKNLFERSEGVTVNEAAACACAGLQQAIARGDVPADESVLLNITGGGYDLIERDFAMHTLEVARTVGDNELNFEELETYEELFNRVNL